MLHLLSFENQEPQDVAIFVVQHSKANIGKYLKAMNPNFVLKLFAIIIQGKITY